MDYFTYKGFKEIKKGYVSFLKKYRGGDLIFEENVSFNDGIFNGYLANGLPFFGEYISENSYQFGLFDKNGQLFKSGLRVENDKKILFGNVEDGEAVVEEDYRSLQEHEINVFSFKRGKPKSRDKSFDTSYIYNGLYLKTDSHDLKDVLPPIIKSPSLFVYKDRVFFGESEKRKPFGYGFYFNMGDSDACLTKVLWMDKTKVILCDDAPIIGSFNSTNILFKNICLSFSSGTFSLKERPDDINSYYKMTSPKREIYFVKSTTEKTYKITESSDKFDQSITSINKAKTDKRICERDDYLVFSLQFGISLLAKLMHGDLSVLQNFIDDVRFDKSLVSADEFKQYLLNGRIDTKAFDQKIKDRIAEDKAEEKRLKEEEKAEKARKKAEKEEAKRKALEEAQEWSRTHVSFYTPEPKPKVEKQSDNAPSGKEKSDRERLSNFETWLLSFHPIDVFQKAGFKLKGNSKIFAHLEETNEYTKKVKYYCSITRPTLLGTDEAKRFRDALVEELQKRLRAEGLYDYTVEIELKYWN